MKKIQISESKLYEIIKHVLLEEEKKRIWETDAEGFEFRLFKVFGGDSEKFAKYLNMIYDKVVVNNRLFLQGTPIESLPDNLYVGGHLYLEGTLITSLPDNLHVGGWLNLEGTQITSLPDNLHVGDNLYLYRCKNLTSLPDNLKVGGDLVLSYTKITSLPDNLVVEGGIYIYGTPLNQNDELVKEYIAKGHDINRIN